MVSTRAIKLKFSEGERVLCYEPDPTKAKVLYDSKVLDVVITKDQRGKRVVEYLIHFQGWNSSWDRCVGEEFVLKDTAENRQLQKDLAEKSQLHLGAYLYRKERKKHNRKTIAERLEAVSEDCCSDSPRMDSEGFQETSSSDDDSSIEDDYISIELTPNLKQILEQDYYLINSNRKLHKLPAEPNIINILELFMRYYYDYVCNENDKSLGRLRSNGKSRALDYTEIEKKMALCREVVDGIRLYFDSTFSSLLLYNLEHDQNPLSTFVSSVKQEDLKNNHNSKENNFNEVENHGRLTRKRVLRSNANLDNSNGHYYAENNDNNQYCDSNHIHKNKLNTLFNLSFSVLPAQAYSQHPPSPSMVYGATHLLRLFVKFPDLLSASTISPLNFKKVLKHLDIFIRFMSEYTEWYGEKHYFNK